MDAAFEECYTRVLTLLRHANFVTMQDLDDKVRLGMFYLMKIYGLGFRHCVRGSWEWLELSKDNGPGLKASDIEDMSYDPVVYAELKKAHDSGIMPEGFGGKKSEEPTKKKTEDWGWLSPTGLFLESEWGTHLEAAEHIIEHKGWEDEFDKWSEGNKAMCPENDFLCQVKGYVLIHNPGMDGGYIVTNVKPFTKKQREFLYDYFLARGNRCRAEMYLRGEEA